MVVNTAQDSMTISSVQVDKIHASTAIDKLDEIKEFIEIVADSSKWVELGSSAFYENGIIEESTGVVLKWNDYNPNSKYRQNGKVLCRIVGSWLKKQSLKFQLMILCGLNDSYRISQLDVKFQLNNPQVTTEGLQRMAYECGLGNYPEIDIKGFDGFHNEISGSFNSVLRSPSVRLANASTKEKELFVYDPIEKHGIANAQHWELRLRNKYIQPVIKRLKPVRKSEDIASKLIVDLILDSVDFTWEGKTWAWYNRIKKAPIVD